MTERSKAKKIMVELIKQAKDLGLFQDKKGKLNTKVYSGFANNLSDANERHFATRKLQEYNDLLRGSIAFKLPINTSNQRKLQEMNQIMQVDAHIFLNLDDRLREGAIFSEERHKYQHENWRAVVLPAKILSKFPLGKMMIGSSEKEIKELEDLHGELPLSPLLGEFLDEIKLSCQKNGYNQELLNYINNIRSALRGIMLINKIPNTRAFIAAIPIENEQLNFDEEKIIINRYKYNQLEETATEFSKLFKDNEYNYNNGFEYRKNCCLFSLLISNYKIPIEKYYKKFGEVNYKSLFNLVKEPADIYEKDYDENGNEYSRLIKAHEEYSEKGDLSCSLNEVIKFFEKFRLSLYVFDGSSKQRLIFKYIHENPHKKISPNPLYLIVHEKHVWQIDNNLESLWKKKLNDEVIYEPSSKYRIIKDFTVSSNFVNSKTELLEAIKQIKPNEKNEIYYNGSIRDLLFDFKFRDGINVSNVKYKNNEIEQMTLTINNELKCVIKKYVLEGERGLNFQNKEEYNCYNEYFEKIYKKILRKEYLSDFNENTNRLLREYMKCPHTGYLNDSYKTTECDTFDKNKAYTSLLMNLDEIPVFSVFDDFEEYNGEEIEDNNYYFIEMNGQYEMIERIITKQKFTYIHGFLLKEIKETCKILNVMKPYKLSKIEGIKELIKELYEDSRVRVQLKKFLINSIIGLTGKRYNKNIDTVVLKNPNEAATYYEDGYNGTIITNSENKEENLYVMRKEKIKELKSSFYPIQLLIYDKQKLELIKMAKYLQSLDFKIHYMHVDCLYITGDISKIDQNMLSNEQNFESIGKYKLNKSEINAEFAIELVENNNYNTYNPRPHIQHTLENENLNTKFENSEETNNILNNNCLILAQYAGSGKSTLTMNYKKEINKLYVCPTGKMVKDYRNKNSSYEACTINEFTGTHVIEDCKMNTFNSAPYSIIIFDEIYQYRLDMLQKIFRYMEAHEDKKYFATGDLKQLEPIYEHFNYVNPEYCDKAIKKLFKQSILLNEIRRLEKQEDKDKLKAFMKDLYENKLKIVSCIEKHFNDKIYESIEDIPEIENKTGLTYYNLIKNELNRYIYKMKYGEDIDYKIGTELICNDFLKVRRNKENVRFIRNDTYEIKDINEKTVILNGVDIGDIEIQRSELKHFDFTYAITCGSIQGMTIEQPYIICDWEDSIISCNWITTAITRSNNFNNLYFLRNSKNTNGEITNIHKKIYSYRKQDRDAGREFNYKEYINYKWVLNALKKCCYKCSRCNCVLQTQYQKGDLHQWSINRIDNSKAHIMDNCEISCLSCNHMYK